MKSSLFVIDTNTLISAFLTENSTPTLAYAKAKRNGSLVVSTETFDEFVMFLLGKNLTSTFP